MSQRLVPEADGAKAVSVLVSAGENGWTEAVPAFLREHLLPTVPDDGKQYVVRISWTIGGV